MDDVPSSILEFAMTTDDTSREDSTAETGIAEDFNVFDSPIESMESMQKSALVRI